MKLPHRAYLIPLRIKIVVEDFTLDAVTLEAADHHSRLDPRLLDQREGYSLLHKDVQRHCSLKNWYRSDAISRPALGQTVFKLLDVE